MIIRDGSEQDSLQCTAVWHSLCSVQPLQPLTPLLPQGFVQYAADAERREDAGHARRSRRQVLPPHEHHPLRRADDGRTVV